MAKRGSEKRPRVATTPSAVKTPVTEVTPEDVIKHEPLSWGLGRVDFAGRWGWLDLDEAYIEELHRELVKREGRTLHNLLKTQEIKDIPTAHICAEAKARLEVLELEEHDTLWELRLPGKRRAWGLVQGSVFHFLWWDPKETVCDPPPRRQRRRRSRP